MATLLVAMGTYYVNSSLLFTKTTVLYVCEIGVYIVDVCSKRGLPMYCTFKAKSANVNNFVFAGTFLFLFLQVVYIYIMYFYRNMDLL